MMHFATADNRIGSASELPDGAVEISRERYKELMAGKASGERVTIVDGDIVTYAPPVYSPDGTKRNDRDPDDPLITKAPPEGLHVPQWDGEQWVEGETAEQREARKKKEADAEREQRNALLAASDWSVLPDAPVADQQAWIDYRQALRDVPEQEGFPTDIDWPTKPE